MNVFTTSLLALSIVSAAPTASQPSDEPPTREEVLAMLRQAIRFFHREVSTHGGYVWRVSGDLTMHEGEGLAGSTKIWVQPPGTPTIGETFLDAYEATSDEACLEAAQDAAHALMRGQLQSGGWGYSVEFDENERTKYAYRDVAERRRQERRTTLDDDTTQAAVRFLMRLDRTLSFQDERLHEAVEYALTALLRAQFPNGGWYVHWDQYPSPHGVEKHPVLPANYPTSWSRTWKGDYPGIYVTNDDLMADMIAVMLAAAETYDDERYLRSAERAGDFLILAQMPDPQPAWAQQYNVDMQPVWARKFEPPAVSGSESQQIMEALMELYVATGEERFLEPIPRAVAYLRRSLLADGRLARFYELETNRPLYFERYGDRYELTNRLTSRLPTHYSFRVGSRLDTIEAEYHRLRENDVSAVGKSETRGPRRAAKPLLAARVQAIIASVDERGAWLEPGVMRSYDKARPEEGVIASAVFVANVRALCAYLGQGE